MATIKVVKSELSSEASNLSSKISSLMSGNSSLVSALNGVSDYDGINVSSAAKTLASNIKNALSDLETASKNINNYSNAITKADIKGKDGKNVDKIEFTYEVKSDGSREGNIIAIWNYFKNKGLSDAAICGILGNISAECSFNPAAIESNGEGHGLIQWSFGRKTKFLNAANAKGVDWRDLNFQLDYLWDESVNPNSSYGQKLAKVGFYDPNVSISKAAYEFHRIVEGSNDTESMIQNNRVAVAKNLYNQYKDKANLGTNSTITSEGISAISNIEKKFGGNLAADTGAKVTNKSSKSKVNNQGNNNNYSGSSYTGGNYTGSSYTGSNSSYSYSSSSSNSKGSSNSSISGEMSKIDEEIAKEKITIEEGNVVTPSRWIKTSTEAFTSQTIVTKSGKKTLDVFEQRLYHQWGNGGWNLSNNGCAVCATTTIIRAFGDEKYKNYTPADVIDKVNDGVPFNFFNDGIKSCLDKTGVKYKYQKYTSINDLANQLKEGTPMIASVRGNGQFFANSSGHSIVLMGLTDDGKVIVGDSYCLFNGSTVYTMDINDLFSVMCNDACSSYATKEVLVIG